MQSWGVGRNQYLWSMACYILVGATMWYGLKLCKANYTQGEVLQSPSCIWASRLNLYLLQKRNTLALLTY